jgi:hypothetical protein
VRRAHLLVLPVVLAAVVALGLPSAADHGTRPIVGPLQPLGDSPNPWSTNLFASNSQINTDLAFWGDRVYQGIWSGFRVIDVSNPAAPIELLEYTGCQGGQGDVLVWNDELLIRSWDANAPGPPPGSTMCGGAPVPPGFEGLHIFDINPVATPTLIASVDLPQGSHTATLVPEQPVAGLQLGLEREQPRTGHRRGSASQPGSRGVRAVRASGSVLPRHPGLPGERDADPLRRRERVHHVEHGSR